jgi:hypothetical protein
MMVEFFADAPPDEGGAPICLASTLTDLVPGACEIVPCAWIPAPVGEWHQISATVDRGGAETECFEENNWAVFTAECETIG